MKKNKLIVIITIIISIVLMLSISILPIASFKAYYLRQYELNNTIINLKEISKINITFDELKIISSNMIDYLFCKNDSMQYVLKDNTNFFSNQAISHMADVKILFKGGIIISIILFIIFLLLSIYIYKNFKNIKVNYFKIYLNIFLIFLIILIFIVIFAIIDFDSLFTIFHHLIFPNKDKFNDAFFSYNDTLIILLPINFFMKIGSIIAITFIILFLIGLFFTYYLNKKQKNLIN